MELDYGTIGTIIGAAAGVITFICMVIRNFKSDMDKKFDSVFMELRQLRTDVQEIKGDMREMKGEMKWLYRHEKVE